MTFLLSCRTPRLRHRRFRRRPPPRPLRTTLLGLRLTHIFDRRAAEKRASLRGATPTHVDRSSIDDVLAERRRRRRRSDRRRRSGRRLDPRRAARRQIGRHREQAGHRPPRRRAADAGGAAGPPAAVRSGGRRRDADRARDRRRARRRSHHARRRDPERHDQRRPVADGGERLLPRRRRLRDARRAAMRRQIRPPISTAATRGAKLAHPVRARVRPARRPGEHRHPVVGVDWRSRFRATRGGAAATIRQIAHAEFDYATRDADGVGRAGRRGAARSIFAQATGAQNAARHHRRALGRDRHLRRRRGRRRHRGRDPRRHQAIARDSAAIVPAPVLTARFQNSDCRFQIRTSRC